MYHKESSELLLQSGVKMSLYSIIGHIRKNTCEMIRDKWVKKSSGGNQANGTNMVGAKMEDFLFFLALALLCVQIPWV